MILSPTKFKKEDHRIYGFDVETCDDNKTFVMASVVGDNFEETFYEKQECINFFKKKRFGRSIIAATNLQFDFNALFFGSKEMHDFKWLYKSSHMLFSKSYIKNKGFSKNYSKNAEPIKFIDTLNYAKMSVEQLGMILKMPKLKVPELIGKMPSNMTEWENMRIYNLRDCEISKKAIEYFYDAFSKMGANPKLTIASTSMSLFKNKYLKNSYWTHNMNDLLEEFKAYYGGNTHAYCRGPISDCYLYDFNSLYPYVMLNEYPDPNSMRFNKKNDIFYIENFEGISDVEVEAPEIDFPLLPFRTDKKLVFPYGNFRAWHSHVELRKAIELGYRIKHVHKTIYFKETCSPFKDFVLDLYDMRMKYKSENNPMELAVKLILNSLYGKFGQRFTDMDNWISADIDLKEIQKYDYIERIGEFFRVKMKYSRPSAFCIPIWALYTTSFARLRLYDFIVRSGSLYSDTDSGVTKKKFYSSDKIGELKLEAYIRKGLIVKPKFYMYEGEKTSCKIKGFGLKIDKSIFMKILMDKEYSYKKFVKFKEAMRRNFIPNEIIDITKRADLEDDKRLWPEPFDPDSFQISRPLKIIDGFTELKYNVLMERARDKYERDKEKQLMSNSTLFEERFGDFFDSKGDDISREEFLENEIFFEKQ